MLLQPLMHYIHLNCALIQQLVAYELHEDNQSIQDNLLYI
jgi:hypothetical protein